MAGAIEAAGPGGFPCPECGTLIPVTINDLLDSGAVKCGACGLALTVDQGPSRDALAMLRDNREVLDQIASSVPGIEWGDAAKG